MISKCPACRESIEFDEDALGTKTTCPFCEREIDLAPPPPPFFTRARAQIVRAWKRVWAQVWRPRSVIVVGAIMLIALIGKALKDSGVSADDAVAAVLRFIVFGAIFAGATVVVVQISKHGLWQRTINALMFFVGGGLTAIGIFALVSSDTVFQEQFALLAFIGGCVIIILSFVLHLLLNFAERKETANARRDGVQGHAVK